MNIKNLLIIKNKKFTQECFNILCEFGFNVIPSKRGLYFIGKVSLLECIFKLDPEYIEDYQTIKINYEIPEKLKDYVDSIVFHSKLYSLYEGYIFGDVIGSDEFTALTEEDILEIKNHISKYETF